MIENRKTGQQKKFLNYKLHKLNFSRAHGDGFKKSLKTEDIKFNSRWTDRLMFDRTVSVCDSPVLTASSASSGDGVHPVGQALPELYSLSMWWSWAGFRAANSALRDDQDAWTDIKQPKNTERRTLHLNCKHDPLKPQKVYIVVVVVAETSIFPSCLCFHIRKQSQCYSLICMQSILNQLYDLVNSFCPTCGNKASWENISRLSLQLLSFVHVFILSCTPIKGEFIVTDTIVICPYQQLSLEHRKIIFDLKETGESLGQWRSCDYYTTDFPEFVQSVWIGGSDTLPRHAGAAVQTIS